MSYIALYRKYRPTTFNDIVGQQNVTTILKNQIKEGKISHAYIFSGSRGTGKTSAAKVFARAVNCLSPVDGEPCNKCEMCKSILEGNSTDIIEMDAASNNSVDNIRQIRQEVAYATVDAKYRIYIIDEAHMLTTSAFNALLKTLEEPPKNVIFILATTEQHKIPVTILSRCLRFEFNKVSKDNIQIILKKVLESENIQYEEEALEYIAKLADGGARDALSILDRCIAQSKEKIKIKDIENIIGLADKESIDELTNSILNFDSISSIKVIDNILDKGKDLRELAYRLSEKFLELLINQQNSDNTSKERYIYLIDRLSKLDNDIRNSSKPAILFKATIVEMCNISILKNEKEKNAIGEKNIENNDNNEYIDMLFKKIEKLEEKVLSFEKNIGDIQTKKGEEFLQSNTTEDTNIKYEKNKDTSKEDICKKEFKESENFKNELCSRGKITTYSVLAKAKMFEDEENIYIVTDNSFAYSRLKLDSSKQDIIDTLKEKYNIQKEVKIILKEKKSSSVSKIEECLKNSDIEFKQID